MGRRANKRKSYNAIQELMKKLTLGDVTETTVIPQCSSDPPLVQPTRRFHLDPSHPFYWHLSNRENRPSSSTADDSTTADDEDDENVAGGGGQNRPPRPLAVITKLKSHSKRRRKERKRKNRPLTTKLATTSSQSNAHHSHGNTLRPSSQAKITLNRKQMKRASKRQRNSLRKRRIVNSVLANDLDQLSLT